MLFLSFILLFIIKCRITVLASAVTSLRFTVVPLAKKPQKIPRTKTTEKTRIQTIDFCRSDTDG